MLKQLPHDLVVEFHRQKNSKNIGGIREGIREKYWILREKARQTIKFLLKTCISCKRFNSNPGSQVTAPLPDVRVMESPPSSVVGLDFAGPLFVKNNDTKQCILLITCAVTRSIHLELVGSMTTDTYLIAFRRFVARRGLCSIAISDNARTLKRAELELQQMWKVLNHADVKKTFTLLTLLSGITSSKEPSGGVVCINAWGVL
ncbi:integrase catalytic domain-containing protein [Trichonephila clavipes]|nr:integrase catalytic domain-containing protein [Trichonephila clavipes]